MRFRVTRKLARKQFWRATRQRAFEPGRNLFDWKHPYFLLDLQRTAHLSLPGAKFVLEWLKDGLSRSVWQPELEPLIEQLRRTPDMLMHDARQLLVETLLLAGVAGASIRWLETRCHASTLAQSEKSSRVARLWLAYYEQAERRNELIWLNVVDL